MSHTFDVGRGILAREMTLDQQIWKVMCGTDSRHTGTWSNEHRDSAFVAIETILEMVGSFSSSSGPLAVRRWQ